MKVRPAVAPAARAATELGSRSGTVTDRAAPGAVGISARVGPGVGVTMGVDALVGVGVGVVVATLVAAGITAVVEPAVGAVAVTPSVAGRADVAPGAIGGSEALGMADDDTLGVVDGTALVGDLSVAAGLGVRLAVRSVAVGLSGGKTIGVGVAVGVNVGGLARILMVTVAETGCPPRWQSHT